MKWLLFIIGGLLLSDSSMHHGGDLQLEVVVAMTLIGFSVLIHLREK